MRGPQAAAYFKIGLSTLWEWRKRPGFPEPVKAGPRVTLFNIDEIERFIAEFHEAEKIRFAARHEVGRAKGQTAAEPIRHSRLVVNGHEVSLHGARNRDLTAEESGGASALAVRSNSAPGEHEERRHELGGKRNQDEASVDASSERARDAGTDSMSEASRK
jgi:predicted DNA-binding transcriptional regulator AlpA